jgi:hypothetical protein
VFNIPETTRAYIYRIALAALAVLSLYGLVGPDEIPVWTSVIMALLGIGSSALATANTGRKLPPPPPPASDSAV